MNKKVLLSSIVCVFGLAINPVNASTIYQHSFSGSDGVNLFGTGIDIDNNGGSNTWSGSTGSFDADGSVDGEGSHGVWLPFSPTSGNIYQLSGSIDYTSGAWITLGFAVGNPNNHFNTIEAEPYGTALVNTGVLAIDGQGLEGQNANAGLSGFNNIDIVLDATDTDSANWTVAFYLEGALVSGPNTVTNSETWPDTGDLGRIQYVGFSTNSAVGTIDDFALTIIPEPCTTLFATLGLTGLLLLRRRRTPIGPHQEG